MSGVASSQNIELGSRRGDAQLQAKDAPVIAEPPRAPFYADFFPLVSFVATITLGASISGSQGFATAGNLLGRALDDFDGNATTQAALKRASDAAKFFAWSTAASSVSLMITLVMQLAMTKPVFARRLSGKGYNWAILSTMTASYCALILQAASLALIGQALKAVNVASGLMIQVRPPWTFVASLTL